MKETKTRMKPVFELCAASYEDCCNAQKYGADRIELNSALTAGGLTPSVALLKQVKKDISLPVICMVRPREGGFCYSQAEADLMMDEAASLLKAGADGIAFGFLNPDGTIDSIRTRQMIELIHSFKGKEAVFHRAFDIMPDPYQAAARLIELGADRILTSGQQDTAIHGVPLLAALQKRFGQAIEILPASGIDHTNAEALLEQTGLGQVHASCKTIKEDPTAFRGNVSFAVFPEPNQNGYLAADPRRIAALRKVLDRMEQAQNR